MKAVCSSLFALILLNSCVKSIPVDLTDHDEKRLVAEGKITDQNELQEFKITWTANLGTEIPETVNDVQLVVNTPSGDVYYSAVGNGKYISDTPFAGIPGESYTISLTRDGTTHSVTTVMPGAVEIDSFKLATTIGIPMSFQPGVSLTLTSDQSQYFRYDLYKLHKPSLPDSLWTNVEIPVYEVFALYPGQQSLVLDQIGTDLYQFDTTDVAKIFVYSISQDVYSYLNKLRTLMTAEPKGGKFENPPYYYSNEAYGLGYGTIVDSAYYSF